MAKKQSKSSGSKGARSTSKAARPAAKPAAKVVSAPVRPAAKAPAKTSAPAAARAKAPAARPAAPASPPPAGPTLLAQAERLRDEIQQSKLTHPDPWSYTSKARAWAARAQALVEQVDRAGDDAATRRAFQALSAEVAADRDFQEARRLF